MKAHYTTAQLTIRYFVWEQVTILLPLDKHRDVDCRERCFKRRGEQSVSILPQTGNPTYQAEWISWE
jgi:hypothetical protein